MSQVYFKKIGMEVEISYFCAYVTTILTPQMLTTTLWYFIKMVTKKIRNYPPWLFGGMHANITTFFTTFHSSLLVNSWCLVVMVLQWFIWFPPNFEYIVKHYLEW
jgi:hypothetical protein